VLCVRFELRGDGWLLLCTQLEPTGQFCVPVSGRQMASAASRWSSWENEGLQKTVFSTDIKGGLCYWEHKGMEEG